MQERQQDKSAQRRAYHTGPEFILSLVLIALGGWLAGPFLSLMIETCRKRVASQAW